MAVPNAYDLASSRGATTYRLLYSDVRVAQTITFDARNWADGYFDNVSYSERLVAESEDGGYWMTSLPLHALLDESKGVHLTWVGEGVGVSYSTDDTNFIVAVSGRTILEDIDTEGVSLTLRVELFDDESWFETLQVDLLSERIMQPFSGTRLLTFKGASMDHTPDHQLDWKDDSGAVIRDGYIQIEPNIEDAPENIRSIELWAKVDDADGFLMGLSGSQYVSVAGNAYTFAGMAAYRNGQPVSNAALPQNEWAHYVFVLTTSTNLPIRFGNNMGNTSALDMNVGHVAAYPQAFTAAEALNLYNKNLGLPALVVNDTSRVIVTETATPIDIYAYTWSNITSER